MIEWALRSAILILVGTLLLKALRIKDASIRLAAWTAMLFGSLAIPVMTTALPGLSVHVTQAAARPMPAFEDAAIPTVSESDVVMPKRTAVESTPFNWPEAAETVYLLVALAMFLRVCIGLAICRLLLRSTRATDEAGILESDQVTAPVTLGIMRPAIVLPADWRDWDNVRRNAVLAHERSHIERHDPALQLLSAIHRALLWFSPMSWFLHSRIVRVAEEASDDAAVAATGDRTAYAEILLDFIRRATPQSNLAGVPMARYGRPDKRIQRILDTTSLSRGVTRWSAAAILTMGVPITYLAATTRPQTVPAITVAPLPIAIAETPPLATATIAQSAPPPKPRTSAPPPPAAPGPKFDVASIKPCDPNANPPGRGGRGAAGGGTTARFRLNCVDVETLIAMAYIRFADGKGRSLFETALTKIEGGPAWLSSDKYTIEAEPDGDATGPMMAGPMMQSLLEERFQLKIHRETREAPVYELTVARGGARVQPVRQGPCVASDFTGTSLPFSGWPEDKQCGFIYTSREGPNIIAVGRSRRMEELVQSLAAATGRLVIDKTGITGNVDYRVVFAGDESTPGLRPLPPSTDGVPVAEDPVAPSIFTAVEQQLGLKLNQARGPRDYLVIDSISRPTPN